MSLLNPIPIGERCKSAETWEGPIKKGQRAVMTMEWEYTHDIFGTVTRGVKGEDFIVDLYVPAEASDTGFAFYHGHRGTLSIVCPAELCKVAT